MILVFQGSVSAQEIKSFAGYSYSIYGTPVAEIYDKFFSIDGNQGLLKCYATIKGDSVFVTNELYNFSHELWKVQHARFHRDSLEQRSVALFWDSMEVKGNVQKTYSMRLYGKGDGGIYQMFSKEEVFIHYFRNIGIFFTRKDEAYQFFDDLVAK